MLRCRWRPARLGHELLVGGELLEGDDLGRELRLVDALLPALLSWAGVTTSA